MRSGKQLGRVAAVISVALATSAVMSAPALAATAPASAAAPATANEERLVGPYATWEACESDRRLYSSRYGYETTPCLWRWASPKNAYFFTYFT
jgi:hypothetical protein